MLRMGKETKLSAAAVIEQAIAYFGQGGLELDVTEQTDCCARFDGGGGYVFVQADEEARSTGSEVVIEGREWDYHVRKFLAEL